MRLIFQYLNILFSSNFINYFFYKKIKFKNKKKNRSISRIINYHFKKYSDKNHINKNVITKILKTIKKGSILVETGVACYGTNSTILFDDFCNSKKCNLFTCDIRLQPIVNLNKILSNKTTLFKMNSLQFLKILKKKNVNADFIYLDSFDLEPGQFNLCIKHGYNEFLLADKILNKGGLILIDDTPLNLKVCEKIFSKQNYNAIEKFYLNKKFIPGKGALVKKRILNSGRYKILYNEYSLLLQKN